MESSTPRLTGFDCRNSTVAPVVAVKRVRQITSAVADDGGASVPRNLLSTYIKLLPPIYDPRRRPNARSIQFFARRCCAKSFFIVLENERRERPICGPGAVDSARLFVCGVGDEMTRVAVSSKLVRRLQAAIADSEDIHRTKNPS
ncbi:hypothetical protein EVAR_19505_1 [Eumeta japonica]|uniref:Uncharacterized protein n=1 Tax=Eumeta variegata TaxID=151549 RepID=A0A4C1VBF2_EUMVA|nr:hypothetical protein EVAR_19505_1 [Eumeta japonica]